MPCEFPLGLLDVTDGRRCRDELSTFECIEFWRARDEAGLEVVADGAGEVLPGLTGSGSAPTTGEEVTDGDMAALVLL